MSHRMQLSLQIIVMLNCMQLTLSCTTVWETILTALSLPTDEVHAEHHVEQFFRQVLTP